MRDLDRQDRAALGQCLANIDHGLGEITRRIKLRETSCTLAVETWTIPASGALSRDWSTPFRAVAVANHSAANDVTVASGPERETAPTSGPGVAIVKATRAAVWNLSGNSLTIYGTAGQQVTVSVFTREQAPSWG